jgi:hypothetical protein
MTKEEKRKGRIIENVLEASMDYQWQIANNSSEDELAASKKRLRLHVRKLFVDYIGRAPGKIELTYLLDLDDGTES